MVTVADALQLDVFQQATLIAGAAGIRQPIGWVHNASVPDVHNWLNGGELILSTIRNMPQDLASQVQYIEALVASGGVGLVVTVGRDLKTVPPEWCAAANQHDFPLITIPYTTRFVDLARAVNERLSHESVDMLRQALHIHQVVTRLVLDGGDLNDLANVLAKLIGQSISIETERFDALASANIATIDEARRYTLEHGRTNPLLIQTLEQEGILAQIQSSLRPYQLPKIPHVGLELERILAPVVVHGDIYGYMWIIADGSPLTDIDWMAIESGATVAALMLLRQEAVQSAEASLKGNLFAQLIEGDDTNTSILIDQALRYGLDLNQPYRMFLLDSGKDMSNRASVRLYRRVNRLATEYDWAAIVGQFAGHVLLLLDDSIGMDTAAQQIQQRLGQQTLCISISGVHDGYGEVSHAYSECQDTLTITIRLRQNQSVACFDDLGYVQVLYQAGQASLERNPLVENVRLLLEETQADLFNTLEVYLDQGGNGVATAESLHIHRSTLNYRLQRIAQLTRADLTDPNVRLNLQITLKQIRLFDSW